MCVCVCVCVCACVFGQSKCSLAYLLEGVQKINGVRFTCFLHLHNKPFVMTAPTRTDNRINQANISLGSVNGDAFFATRQRLSQQSKQVIKINEQSDN